jgi:hypothetical protein
MYASPPPPPPPPIIIIIIIIIIIGKVIPALSVTEHHAMKAYWGVEV